MKPLLALLLLAATGPALAETLVVRVTGAGAGGQVVASLYQSADGFGSFNTRKAAQVKTAPATAGPVTLRFENLAPGRYAVAAFHDEDSNLKVRTNFIGIPREPVGVSNNTGGMPSFSKSLVSVPAAAGLDISLRRIGG